MPPLIERHPSRRTLVTVGVAMVMAGCGFRLRSSVTLAFETLRMTGSTQTSVARELRLALINQGVRVDSSSEVVLAASEIPQVVLTVSQDQRQRVVVGQTSAGQVRELELRTLFTFNLTNAAGLEVIATTSLMLTRSLNFSETAVLAKDAEEARLYIDMQNDMVAQVMRRLSAVRTV